MKKKAIKSFLAFMIVTSGFAYGAGSTASANEELREKLEDLEEKKNSNDSESEEAESEREEILNDIQEIQEEIRELDEEMASTNEDISEKEDDISETESRIDELHEQIEELEERIAERDELLKDRVRAMYQNGGSVDYLEVLMGANSFGDLLDRVSALNTIADQDRDILESHIKDQEDLEAAKAEVEEQLSSLEESKANLEDLKAEQESQQSEKENILGGLEDDEELLEETLIALEDEEALLQEQEEAAQKELEAYETREAEKREEEERREAEAAAAAEEEEEAEEESSDSSESDSSESDSSDSSSSSSSAAPSDSGGTLMKPAEGSYTSEYGQRWGRMHHGIDIGSGGRSGIPIVAAESGTVVNSSYMNGYGNTVMISHNIGGKQITTLYAHMSSTKVSSGQSISRGDQIGVMGETGASQGVHLHFEVHEGSWNGSKSNSVNPRNYLP
ncbi:murein hydrolase activator EnvC family protein [Alteribacillus sp. HJP-4]|uniref:murein hydrolase activator EnvC family protein n=1 Tax=Alteribacillus sp. HJP-4 TaxID=2775394 RepID=UPI0035CD2DFA